MNWERVRAGAVAIVTCANSPGVMAAGEEVRTEADALETARRPPRPPEWLPIWRSKSALDHRHRGGRRHADVDREAHGARGESRSTFGASVMTARTTCSIGSPLTRSTRYWARGVRRRVPARPWFTRRVLCRPNEDVPNDVNGAGPPNVLIFVWPRYAPWVSWA